MIGVPIATVTARIACQWVRSNQSIATQSPRSKSGSLAMFAAIRLASSFVSNLAADRRPDPCARLCSPAAHAQRTATLPLLCQAD